MNEFMEAQDKVLLEDDELLTNNQKAPLAKIKIKAKKAWIQSEEGKYIIELSTKWANELDHIEKCLLFITLDDIEERIASIETEFIMDNNPLNMLFLRKGKKIERLNKLKRWLSVLRNVLESPEKERSKVLSTIKERSLRAKIKQSLENQRILQEATTILTNLENQLETINSEGFKEQIKLFEEKLHEVKGASYKKQIIPYNTKKEKIKREWEYNRREKKEKQKNILINLIDDCQLAKAALENSDYARCEEILDIADLFYENLLWYDKNTKLVRKVLDDIRNTINSINLKMKEYE